MSEDLPLADALTTVFARMSGLLLSEETVGTALHLVTGLAKETIPATAGAGVTLIDERGRKTTAAASDALVERADMLQYELEEGPCLSAWAERKVIRIDEISTDRRWPRWCKVALPLGLRSTLSAPLVARDAALGAIKVYSREPASFDERSELLLTRFSAQAAILLSNVQTVESAKRLSDQLKEALQNRDVISTAKGILMAFERIDEEAAFAMLVRASQRENKKLRDIAQFVVRSTLRRQR